MKPLKIHHRPTTKQVEIVMMFSASVDSNLLRTHPHIVKSYVGTQLLQDAQRHIDETDFSNVVYLDEEAEDLQVPGST